MKERRHRSSSHPQTSTVQASVVTPDGKYAVSAESNTRLVGWELNSGNLTHRWEKKVTRSEAHSGIHKKAHARDIDPRATGGKLLLAASPDGTYIVFGGGGFPLTVYDIENGDDLALHSGRGGDVSCLTIGHLPSHDSSGSVKPTIVAGIATGGVELLRLECVPARQGRRVVFPVTHLGCLCIRRRPMASAAMTPRPHGSLSILPPDFCDSIATRLGKADGRTIAAAAATLRLSGSICGFDRVILIRS